MIYDMIYVLTVIALTPGGSSTAHIYTQTVHRTTKSTQTMHRITQLIYAWFSIISTLCPSMEVYRHFDRLYCLHLQGSNNQRSLTVHHEDSAIPQNVAKRYPMTQLHILAELQAQ